MEYIISFCAFPMCIIPWLLSGLLGLLAGYLLWARWKSKFEEMEGKYNALRKTNASLEADLKDCSHHRATLEGDLSTAHGMVKEMQLKLDATENAKPEESVGDIGNIASSFVAGAVTGDLVDAGGSTVGDAAVSGSGKYSSLKSDNLQIIEGIGPKMESVLHEAGVKNWADLAAKSPADVRAILDSHGDKYKIINPDSWPQQAALANTGKWDELILLQKQLDTGADTNIGLTDSKLEKLVGASVKGGFGKYKENDLKIVEGIGPKISDLLKDAGIKTWRDLSNTPVDKIQEVLEAAGPRYKLAKPGSWPQQAGLAADGKWDELKKLQDELNGGV